MIHAMRKKMRAAAMMVGLAVIFAAGIYVGDLHLFNPSASAQTSFVASTTQPSSIDMSQFWTVYSLLNNNFVVTHASTTFPTQQQQMYGAIEGLTASFGDPYTVFLPPDDAQVFESDVNGSFGGVGMSMDVNSQNQLEVLSPLKDTPASRAGIHSGDIITMIGTTSTDGLSTNDAVKLIRGPVGTKITLTLSRAGVQTPIVVTLTRETINIPIIDTTARPDGVFVINLYSFSENSADLFRDALRQFVQSGDHKLVLDMRGNPGGYLESAVQMASYFLPLGSTVVTEDYEGKQQNDVSTSYGYNVFAGDPNFKMAILIDQDTASAAEILSGALQQHGVAKLVGTRSFGKGSVQQLVDVGGGAELKITIARWLTPNGQSISQSGLTPDIPATRTQDDVNAGNDPQMTAAVKYLLGQ